MHNLKIIRKEPCSRKGYYVRTVFYDSSEERDYEDTYGPFTDIRALQDFLAMLDSMEEGVFRVKGASGNMVSPYPRCNVYWCKYLHNVPDEYFEIPEEKQKYITKELIDKINFSYLCNWVGGMHVGRSDYITCKEELEEDKPVAVGEFKHYIIFYVDNYGSILEVKDENDKAPLKDCTWLPEHKWRVKDFENIEYLAYHDGKYWQRGVFFTGTSYEGLQQWIKHNRIKTEQEVLKWRYYDYGKLAYNPWRDLDGNVLKNQNAFEDLDVIDKKGFDRSIYDYDNYDLWVDYKVSQAIKENPKITNWDTITERIYTKEEFDLLKSQRMTIKDE